MGCVLRNREQGGRPGCFAPLSLPPHRIPYSIQNNQVVARAATRNGAADEGRAVVVVWNYDSDRGVARRVWEQHAAALARFFPRKKEEEASASASEKEEEEEEEEKRNGERKREFPRRVQARADAALRGARARASSMPYMWRARPLYVAREALICGARGPYMCMGREG
eukprot:3791422-Rhodomonas_salina.6